MYDILLKDGTIIDPAQGMHKVGSVAIQNGKIAEVADAISESEAQKVFPMEGKIISPGLIDMHCHPAGKFAGLGVPPDEIGLNTGVTLLGDAGTSGAANFNAFRALVVEPAKTDILCFLNLSHTGLVTVPEIFTEQNIDISHSKETIEANRDIIRGVKIRCVKALAEGPGIRAVENGKRLASDHNLPLMIHVGETRKRTDDLSMDAFSRAAVSLLDTGDIISHYLTWEPGGLILKDGTVYPELEAAHKRGAILDTCNGLKQCILAFARHAIAQGLIPDVVSTDLVTISLPSAQSLAVTMSKFINLGLSVDQVIGMSTVNAAKALGEESRRGSLKPGMTADITVMELKKGDYLFCDGTGGERMQGEFLLEPQMVFKDGRAHPAYAGYHIPPVYTPISK